MGGRYSNGFIIFDYQTATDFKFAGAYAGTNQWIMGRRTTSGWVVNASLNASIDALTDYRLQVDILEDSEATLYVDGTAGVPHVQRLLK